MGHQKMGRVLVLNPTDFFEAYGLRLKRFKKSRAFDFGVHSRNKATKKRNTNYQRTREAFCFY